MQRPLSQLIHARIQDGAGSPRIITLHKHFQYGAGVREYALAAAPEARIIGLEASKGVFIGHVIRGYTWFLGPQEQPSPFYFGDALAEIERFLWDDVDRQDGDRVELPFLLGVEQGAIMALAMAAVVPDLLSGVIAIDPIFPVVAGWEPPLAPLNGLPILLAEESPRPELPAAVLAGDRLAEVLRGWGGVVETASEAGDALANWMLRQRPRVVDRSGVDG